MTKTFDDLTEAERDEFFAAFYELWDADPVLSGLPHDTESCEPWGAPWCYAAGSEAVSVQDHFAGCVEELRRLTVEQAEYRAEDDE